VKDIILSIKPCFSNEIYSGSKIIELRKSIGKEFFVGSKIYIYSSSPTQAVDGHARIKKIEQLPVKVIRDKLLSLAKISLEDFDEYYKNHEIGSVIWLCDVTKFDEALKLQDLKPIGFSAPQSFSYVGSKIKPLLENMK